jgi:hypothetical protein
VTTLRELRALVSSGESATVELKRSTGELREAMQTICAFANAKGGQVVIGAKPNGEIIGQQVAEQTLHEISAARDRFEPPLDFDVERVKANATLTVLVLTVAGLSDSVPYTYDGRPFERVNNTTRKMPRERFEALLLERMHSRRRWENQIADEMTIKDIDRDEVFRILRNIEGAGRISGPSARTRPRRSIGSGCARTARSSAPPWCCSARSSCRTTRSARSAWLASAARTRPSSWTSAACAARRSSCSKRRSCSASATSRCRRKSSRHSYGASRRR